LFACFFQVFAANNYAQTKKLTLSMDKATIAQVLQAIEDQSEFKFFYNNQLIDVTKRVDVEIRRKNIWEVLESVLPDAGITYRVVGKQVALFQQVPGAEKPAIRQQPVTVTGKVTGEDGNPLPGVNIVVKGTTTGTISDADGNYNIEVEDPDATLVFSFIGYYTREVVVGNQTSINVTMEEKITGLDEVIVTALGISREKRQLTYAIQQIDGEELIRTGNTNLTKGLQGKFAGVTIRQTSGLPGAGAQVLIRGSTSITGSNSPLYIVDGSPIDGVSSINPNQIESLSVLKGATAAALYGLRASNGVIVITTKRGKENELNRPTISVNSKVSIDDISVKHEVQMLYGQGVGGVYSPYTSLSFGPKISEWGTYTNQLGEQEVARAYDNLGNIMQTGITEDINVNLSNRFEGGNYNVGISHSGQRGIIPNTSWQRTSINVASDYKIFKNLTWSTFFNFSSTLNKPNPSNTIFWGILFAPASYDLANKPTHVEGNEYEQLNFRGQHDNPVWSLDHNYVEQKTSSLITTNAINYNPVKWLNLDYKLAYDEGLTTSKSVYAYGSQLGGGRTVPPSGGLVTDGSSRRITINSNFLARINHRIADKLDFELLAGHEYRDYWYNSLSSTGRGFTMPEFHNLKNCATITSGQSLNRYRSYAFFGNLNVDYAGMLNLTASVRNDVVSSMPRDSRSFIYPSIGIGFAFTEAMNNKPDFLEFGRVRVSYAEVGQAGGIYSTSTVYVPGSVSRFSFPYQGINAYTLSSSLKSTNLEPENTKQWETGFNLIFLNNRINFDYTYFNSISEGQIFSVPVSSATGFSSEVRNAGIMTNKGHEIELSIKPVVTQNFSWNIATNFTSYVNKVKELAEGVEELTLGQNVDVAVCVAQPGKEYPMLRGYGFLRDPNTGKVVVESDPAKSTYGIPLRSPAKDVILGKVNPDFEINFMNTFNYRNFSLYAQVDWRQGGKIASGEARLGRVYGMHKETENRDEPYLYPDAVKGTYVDGELVIEGDNDIVIAERTRSPWGTAMDGIREWHTFDASFIRLREVRLSYDFSRDLLSRIKIQHASLSLYGRNLWLIQSGLHYYDPEMSPGTGNAQGYTTNAVTYPQIRSLGLSLELTF